MYEDKEYIHENKLISGEVRNVDYIASGSYIHAGAFVFRNILTKERINFLKQINRFDDNLITIYMLQFGDLYYIKKPVYCYRQLSSSLWNRISETEQHILNAMSYKTIVAHLTENTIPLVAIEKRQYPPLKILYKNRKSIKKILGNSYESYVNQCQIRGCNLVLKILKWENLNLINKIKLMIKMNLLRKRMKHNKV